ncbi:hypothetical protein F4777DRAFT_299462 [Nemania sp. FL0916]|nr:hypothetical protein F4777DRAFT_299462 [Nemania sp. FL0916]
MLCEHCKLICWLDAASLLGLVGVAIYNVSEPVIRLTFMADETWKCQKIILIKFGQKVYKTRKALLDDVKSQQAKIDWNKTYRMRFDTACRESRGIIQAWRNVAPADSFHVWSDNLIHPEQNPVSDPEDPLVIISPSTYRSGMRKEYGLHAIVEPSARRYLVWHVG